MTSPYWKRQTDEDLIFAIEDGLTHAEPCRCGTPDEGSCPACGRSLEGVDALKELVRRYVTDVSGEDDSSGARRAIEDFAQQLDRAIGEWPDKLQRTLLRVGLAREKEKYLQGLNAP